jgi:hypothetical protein
MQYKRAQRTAQAGFLSRLHRALKAVIFADKRRMKRRLPPLSAELPTTRPQGYAPK